ncbi:MAG: DUF6445 family protein [Alphaproteobacteria bacterium]
MPLQLLVYDNFLGDPMGVRNAALRLEYPRPAEKPNYPGRNSARPLMIQGVEEAVSKIVGEKLIAAPRTAHCYVRSALDGDDDNRLYNIHIDQMCWWAGILYLTLPEHCRGGTEFYRHRETASDHAPIYNHELERLGAKTWGQAGEDIIERDSVDDSKWEHLMTVPMRFNRLILLRPWLWHTAGRSFGTAIENGRLIQGFFFVPPAATTVW